MPGNDNELFCLILDEKAMCCLLRYVLSFSTCSAEQQQQKMCRRHILYTQQV